MKDQPLRLFGTVTGDVAEDPGARTKYGGLFEALGRQFHVAAVHDTVA